MGDKLKIVEKFKKLSIQIIECEFMERFVENCLFCGFIVKCLELLLVKQDRRRKICLCMWGDCGQGGLGEELGKLRRVLLRQIRREEFFQVFE